MRRICTRMVKNAFERRELQLYYQPQVDLRSGRIVGLEALLRWTHPKIGSINPLTFLSIVEYTDSFIQIGSWAIRSACEQNSVWQSAGCPGMPIAVNVSARQLENSDILGAVTSALDAANLPPEYLEIEITEHTAIRNIKAVAKTLEALKGVGIKIAIDDFGTQYASFGYIKDLPIDIVKIDKCFVDDIGRNPRAEAILRSMVSLANSLGICLIAEGVETKKQLTYLSDIGCNVIQGFYFYRPMPADAVSKLFAEPRRDAPAI